MTGWPGLIDVFETAWGRTPADVIASGRAPTQADLQRLLSTHRDWTPPTSSPEPGTLWPLISHHTFPSTTGLRGFRGSPKVLTGRLLVQLLGCHGLVLADPLRSVRSTQALRGDAAGLDALTVVLGQLAELQPLLAGGVLRVTKESPSLADPDRAAVVNALGLVDMSVFADLVEWGEFARGVPNDSRRFVSEVRALFAAMGLPEPALTDDSVTQAQHVLAELGAAIIEVSWQMSVCSRDPSCDAFIGDGLERRVLDALLATASDDLSAISRAASGPLRHMERLAAGALPLPDMSVFSASDALAIRQDDSFERWRHTLNKAIDRYDAALATSARETVARSSFAEEMQEASAALRRDARRASFADRFSEDSIPTGLAIIGAAGFASISEAGWAAAAGASAIIWKWLRGRQQPGQEALARYVTLFGEAAR